MFNYYYKTPDGFSDIRMRGNENVLTGLWFEGSEDTSKHTIECDTKLIPVFEKTIEWLDIYFSGESPEFVPDILIENLTPFRREVIEILLDIPFGCILTYGDIAKKIALKHGINKMSSRAVGQAVGWNPVCLVIPCHRVIGAGGRITGYGGGIGNKIALLKHEGVEFHAE